MDPSRRARDLASAAYDVADEHRAGKLAHLSDKAWSRTWQNLVAELARRSPGWTKEEYDRALDRGFIESR